MLSNGVCDLHPQEHPIDDKILHLDDVQSFKYGTLDRVGIGHGFLGTASFGISSSIGEPDHILCLPAFYHTDVHELFPSWWHTQGLQEGPSNIWWIVDWPLFLDARNARTCSRSYRYSSMINTLCTAFWVPSRAINIIRCYPHPESCVLILDWKD